MTAKELHDHVIQWPEGARPKGLDWDDKLGSWIASDPAALVNDDHAIALHVASGLEWLIEILNGIRVFPANDAGTGWYIDNGCLPPGLVARGPTLFHAIHAAILATKENA